jgi:predicted metalloprotease with PDZ domain
LAIDDLGLKLGAGDFDDFVTTGKRTRLSDGALGDCFEPRDVSYDVSAPGFDVAASRAAGKATGVDPKGPAAAAGLKEGVTLVHIDGSFDKTDEPVRIEVARPGGAAVVTYKPSSGGKRGQAFKRKEGVSESACKKLLPRH